MNAKIPPLCGGTHMHRISSSTKWAGFGCPLARAFNELFNGS